MADFLPELRGYFQKTMAEWQVPGMAVSLVRDGELMMSEGFGLRDIERKLPVTGDTLMAIGSCSKAFTSTAVAQLVDDGVLEWDKPLRHYLPDWAMRDPFATERMTPRDLLCHRSGLPGHDFLWYNTMNVSREDLYRRVRYLEPTADFRTTFQYQNLLYMVAGYLIEVVTGKTWEQFTRERIFEPLGMKTSNFSVDESQKAADFSQPYELKDGKIAKMAFANIDNIGPAGSINSSVNEMARWVLVQLKGGKHGDKSLVSESNLFQVHAGHTPVYDPVRMRIYGSDTMVYALGWMVQYHRGHRLIWHSGGIDGFIANVSFMPDLNAGMVVLTNLNVNRMVPAVVYSVYDRLLGISDFDWSERFKTLGDDMAKEEAEAAAKFDSARVPDTSPSHPLDAYTGSYEHPGYGVITVKQDGGGLVQTYNDLSHPVKHYHYDTFETVFEIEMRRQRLTMTYTTDRFGKIVSVAVPFEPMLPPIEFKRRAD